MTRTIINAGYLVVLASAMLFGCGTGNGGPGGGGASGSGTAGSGTGSSGSTTGSGSSAGTSGDQGSSCPNGNVPADAGVPTDPACLSCIDSLCVRYQGCSSIMADCASYLTCVCACAPQDTTCHNNCQPSTACALCLNGASVCVALNATCSTLCGNVAIGVPVGSDGGTPASCTQLLACCDKITNQSMALDCATVGGANNGPDCQQLLTAFQGSGTCP